MKSFKFLGFLGVSLALSGCATVYEPAASPRVTFTTAGVFKDGRYVGSLSYGTPDAVRGNAIAESEAQLGKKLSIAGWVFQAGALGGLTAGTIVAYQDKDESKAPLVLGLYFGALAMSLVGDLLWIAGDTHSTNAINIYNDGLEPSPPMSASAPTGAAATH